MSTNNWIYTAVFLTETSRKTLLNRVKELIPNDWKIICHHMTIAFNNKSESAQSSYEQLTEHFGEVCNLTITHIGISKDAIAVKVLPNKKLPTINKINHITIAIPQGGKPVNSNYITNWKPISNFVINGKISSFNKNE